MITNVTYDYSGRVVAVTGAATGIGRATAVAFAGAGASVFFLDVDTRRTSPQPRGPIPVGRYQDTDEVASWVLFLASREAGFVTGHVTSVNGGRYMAG